MSRDRKRGKRKHFTDSQIQDALDACNYSIPEAAKRLGLTMSTLYKWINEDPTLKSYRNSKMELDALKARDTLNKMLDKLDSLDPRSSGHVISICKILLDKAEANKQDFSITQTSKEFDEELEDKINKLLGEE